MNAIEFDHVGKQYRLGLVSTGTFSDDLTRWWTMHVRHKEDPFLKIGETNDRSHKGSSNYVWALKDINFNVEQGDVVGIIGKNGAGKSTLLKLLSRVTTPTVGEIRARGRIASLLEVGTGFHPEMTGRENIYLNGAIMGMTKAEITRKLDEIVDFSGCERYIDTPVKRYSSGMTVRLGFAIAAHLEPEILVVDEVLAVGDAEFQKKAIGKMQDVSKGEGRTVLFVSHNMAAVRSLCKSGVVLSNGMVEHIGTADECVEKYIASNYENNQTFTWERRTLDGRKNAQLIKAEVMGVDLKPRGNFSCDEDIYMKLTYQVKEKIPGLYGYLEINKIPSYDIALVSDSNDEIMNKMEQLPMGISTVMICLPHRTLAPGEYLIGSNLNSTFDTNGFYVDEALNICKFEVHDYKTNRGDYRKGYSSQILKWEIQ